MPKNFIKSIAVLIGYIIGVGMFGLPYLISRSGILVFIIMIVVLGFVQHFLHLIYANVILVTKDYHRLPGYAGVYLGKNGKKIATLAKLVGNYGALLAYIIITGIFLNQLFGPILGGSEFIYATILFSFEAIIIYLGVRMFANVELVMTALLLLVVGLIIFKGGAEIKLVNYSLINWKYALLPYGAILFAVDGNGAIPIVVQLLRRNKKRVRKAIIIGTFTAVVVVILFSVVITGISGLETSHDALTGLRGLIGSSIISFALVFGILTMITSFLGVSEAVREMLTWDYKIDKRLAWALALFVPYGLYIAGLKSFIEVISFAGAVAGGTSAIILVLIFIRLEKMKDKLVLFKRPPKHLITSLLIGLFIIGVLYEIINFINS